MLASTQMGRAKSPSKAFFRDHPVAHVLEPIELAGLAVDRFGQKCDILDDAHDLVAPLHVDEPFVNQTEQQLRLAAPAMRIAVRIFLDREEAALLLKLVENPVGGCGIVGRLAGELAEAFEEDAGVIERGDRDEALALYCRARKSSLARNRERCRTMPVPSVSPTTSSRRRRGHETIWPTVRLLIPEAPVESYPLLTRRRRFRADSPD